MAKLKRRSAGNIDAATVRIIIARQTECFWCSCPLDGVYHIDHVVPVAKGGTNSLDNLVLACPTCNRNKSAKDPIEYANSIGWVYGELLMRLDELNTWRSLND